MTKVKGTLSHLTSGHVSGVDRLFSVYIGRLALVPAGGLDWLAPSLPVPQLNIDVMMSVTFC